MRKESQDEFQDKASPGRPRKPTFSLENVGHTPSPRSSTGQLIMPLIVVFKSTLNSIIKRGTAGPRPPTDHPAASERKETEMKAMFFFHRGQLRGSLGSLLGWGIRTISESLFFLSDWESCIRQ